MSKTSLSTIVGPRLILRVPTDKEQLLIGVQHSSTLLICLMNHADEAGTIVGQVEVDDLFDRDGNRFHVDLEI